MHLEGMKLSADPRTRRRTIAVIACGVIVLALVGIGAYGLLRGPRPSEPPTTAPAPVEATPAPSVTETAPRPTAPVIAPTRDAETFARRVATALFTWDTGSGLFPLDYATALIDVGDPSGIEQAGLASDVAGYLPTRDAWIELRKYETAQTLTIDTLTVPAEWNEAVAQARPGQLPPGATAYTVEGTRSRTGDWDGAAQAMSEKVAFTIFMACPPTKGDCYLLRLSQLDSPLK